ncbi:MAG: hypothetical protein LBL46_00240 [Rickettsiales bacterium]|jgi:hypothetical protein|nr:hypothetical protein [Rickettsiales bacterium]
MKKLFILLALAASAAPAAKFCKISVETSGYASSVNEDGLSGNFGLSPNSFIGGTWRYVPGGDQCYCKITNRGSGNEVRLGNKISGDYAICGSMCALVLYAGSNRNIWEDMLR